MTDQSSAANLKDASYHHILEALFRLASSEKQNYLSGKTVAARTKAEVNLSDCADALRLIIKAGSHRFRPKTVKAIIEHVTQLLPASAGGYCAGLTRSYFRVLETVLQRQNHVEELDLEDWQTTVDFCLQGIKVYCQHLTNPVASQQSTRISLTQRSSSNTANTQKTTVTISGQNAEDLMSCLLFLVAASNSPVMADAGDIVETIIMFLQSEGSVNTIHKTAFQALNHVISIIYADSLALSHSIAVRIVPIICRLWSLRAVAKDSMLNSVRDQMLITLFTLDLHFQRLVHDGIHPNLYTDLEELLQILRIEYSKRMDRDKLQTLDLDLELHQDDHVKRSSLQVGVLPLSVHGPEQERKWAILKVLGMLEGLIYHCLTRENSETTKDGADSNDENDLPSKKRQRVEQPLQALVARLSASDANDRLTALQSAVMIVPHLDLLPHIRLDLLHASLQCITDTRIDIASWALLTIAM